MTIDTGVGVATQSGQRPMLSQGAVPTAARFASTLFSSRSTYLNIALSSPHWQLKDLLISATDSNTATSESSSTILSFVHNNRVHTIDYACIAQNKSQSQSQVITSPLPQSSITFRSSPRCLDQCNDILVTGGINGSTSGTSSAVTPSTMGLHKGAFGIHVKSTGYQEDVSVGEFINNNVSISQQPSSSSSHYNVYLCNNDKHLYTLDITPSAVLNSQKPIYMKVALNHAATSPINDTLITLGDTNKIFISHPLSTPPSNYDSLLTQGDCGFSTAFLHNGLHFVSCFQDGLALLYDLRNMSSPLHEIHSTRPKTQPGAFRVVKTSDSNDDIIAISEHQGRVHLLNIRNMENHSVLMLPKYLYNVPPTILSPGSATDVNADITEATTTATYPVAVSALPQSPNSYSTPSTLYYNQPIVKPISTLKEMSHFGGELNMGYLESYRYMDNRFSSLRRDYVYRPPNSNSSSNDNSCRIALQGSYDREDLLQRRSDDNSLNELKNSTLLKYGSGGGVDPVQVSPGGKIRNAADEMWWNSTICDSKDGGEDDDDNDDDNDDHGDDDDPYAQHTWPWGKQLHPQDAQLLKKPTLGIMEVPQRDPFFYVDSDIEINGLELASVGKGHGQTSLCIGTKEGIIVWEIDQWGRRCFPKFEYA